jgi:hypothetical protein
VVKPAYAIGLQWLGPVAFDESESVRFAGESWLRDESKSFGLRTHSDQCYCGLD